MFTKLTSICYYIARIEFCKIFFVLKSNWNMNRYFKWYLKLFFLITIFQQAFAGNFYIGAGAGIANSADKQTTISQGMAPIIHELGDICFTGSGFGGYHFDFKNNFDLGTELFFTVAPRKINSELPGKPTYPYRIEDFSLRYAYGIRALPGYKFFPDTIGYMILGITGGSFMLHDTGANSITSANFAAYGYQLGLGVSSVLYKNLGGRLDFIYAQYATHKTNAINTYGPLAGTSMVYKDSPSSFSAIFSLTYKFI
jgi:hypothetical protein